MMDEALLNRKILDGRFEELINQVRECYEWLEKFELERQAGWDLLYPFENLKARIQKLIYLYSDLFARYVKYDVFARYVKYDERVPDEAIVKLRKDLSSFISFLISDDLARALNDPENKSGEIINAVAQIRTFLSYVTTVLEQTVIDISERVPRKFVEHALKNAGLVPTFKELKKIKEETA